MVWEGKDAFRLPYLSRNLFHAVLILMPRNAGSNYPVHCPRSEWRCEWIEHFLPIEENSGASMAASDVSDEQSVASRHAADAPPAVGEPAAPFLPQPCDSPSARHSSRARTPTVPRRRMSGTSLSTRQSLWCKRQVAGRRLCRRFGWPSLKAS